MWKRKRKRLRGIFKQDLCMIGCVANSGLVGFNKVVPGAGKSNVVTRDMNGIVKVFRSDEFAHIKLPFAIQRNAAISMKIPLPQINHTPSGMRSLSDQDFR